MRVCVHACLYVCACAHSFFVLLFSHAQKYFAGFTRDGALKERVHLSMGLLTHGTSTKLDRYQVCDGF